jgi:hypothetical protein
MGSNNLAEQLVCISDEAAGTKIKASKVIFLVLLPGSKKQLHLAVEKSKGIEFLSYYFL